MAIRLDASTALPPVTLPLVGGGDITIGGASETWQLVIVYRGKHCPLCKMYLGTLNDMADEFASKGVEIVTLSADPLEKAEPDKAEMGIDLAVAYDLDIDTMRSWGLFISEPRSDQETDRPFAEPALFLLRPDSTIQIIDVSNAPFVRPDLSFVLRGVSAAIDNGYPVRGTAG